MINYCLQKTVLSTNINESLFNNVKIIFKVIHFTVSINVDKFILFFKTLYLLYH